MNAVRVARQHLALSQRAFAALIDVSVETVRAWDSGRRRIPAEAVAYIRSAALQHLQGEAFTVLDAEAPTESAPPPLRSSPDASGTSSDATSQNLSSLREVARAIGVSVYTLRAAVRDGRLAPCTVRAWYSVDRFRSRPSPMAWNTSAATTAAADDGSLGRRCRSRSRQFPQITTSSSAHFGDGPA